MQLDSSVPCRESFASVDIAELNDFVSDGAYGVGYYQDLAHLEVILSSEGGLSHKLLDGEQMYFRYNVPTKLFADVKHPFPTTILVNNRQIFGLLLGAPAERFLVFR